MPRDVGADGDAPRPPFGQLLHHAVRRKQHVRPVADEEVAPHLNANGLQGVDFRQQRSRIED